MQTKKFLDISEKQQNSCFVFHQKLMLVSFWCKYFFSQCLEFSNFIWLWLSRKYQNQIFSNTLRTIINKSKNTKCSRSLNITNTNTPNFSKLIKIPNFYSYVPCPMSYGLIVNRLWSPAYIFTNRMGTMWGEILLYFL